MGPWGHVEALEPAPIHEHHGRRPVDVERATVDLDLHGPGSMPSTQLVRRNAEHHRVDRHLTLPDVDEVDVDRGRRSPAGAGRLEAERARQVGRCDGFESQLASSGGDRVGQVVIGTPDQRRRDRSIGWLLPRLARPDHDSTLADASTTPRNRSSAACRAARRVAADGATSAIWWSRSLSCLMLRTKSPPE